MGGWYQHWLIVAGFNPPFKRLWNFMVAKDWKHEAGEKHEALMATQNLQSVELKRIGCLGKPTHLEDDNMAETPQQNTWSLTYALKSCSFPQRKVVVQPTFFRWRAVKLQGFDHPLKIWFHTSPSVFSSSLARLVSCQFGMSMLKSFWLQKLASMKITSVEQRKKHPSKCIQTMVTLMTMSKMSKFEPIFDIPTLAFGNWRIPNK